MPDPQPPQNSPRQIPLNITSSMMGGRAPHANDSNTNIIISAVVLVIGAIILAFVNVDALKPQVDQRMYFPKGVVVMQPLGRPAITLNVDVAGTPDRQSRGLMFRDYLGEDEGMLFVFDRPSVQSFWMKNTPLPLDIIFIGPSGTILNIAANTIPNSEKTYMSVAPAIAVVEVRAGLAAKWGLHPGARVAWKVYEDKGKETP